MTSSPDESETLDSEWFGQVPASWRVVKFGRSVRLVTEKATQSAFKIALENVESWSGNYLDVDSQDLAGDGVEFLEGDLLFGKLRPYLAKVWLADRYGAAVGDFHVYRPIGYESSYLLYLLVNRSYIEMVNSSTYGSKMPRVSWDFIRNIAQPLPPLDEQRQIAEYLDRETGKIDELITKQEELVATLTERRQSLIGRVIAGGLNPNEQQIDIPSRWISTIPIGWVSTKLKWYATVQTGVTLGKEVDDGDAVELPYLRVANVQVGFVDLHEVKTVSVPSDSWQRHLLRSGDVLMTEGGDIDKLGRGSMWLGEIALCIHQNHIFAVRCKPGLLNSWLVYALDAPVARQYFRSTAKKTTNLASTNSTTVGELPLALPPLEVQHDVVRFLNENSRKINDLVRKAEAVITLFKERRAALISAAVTGKVDVRGL